jgi:hypothetical protein
MDTNYIIMDKETQQQLEVFDDLDIAVRVAFELYYLEKEQEVYLVAKDARRWEVVKRFERPNKEVLIDAAKDYLQTYCDFRRDLSFSNPIDLLDKTKRNMAYLRKIGKLYFPIWYDFVEQNEEFQAFVSNFSISNCTYDVLRNGICAIEYFTNEIVAQTDVRTGFESLGCVLLDRSHLDWLRYSFSALDALFTPWDKPFAAVAISKHTGLLYVIENFDSALRLHEPEASYIGPIEEMFRELNELVEI